MTLTTCGIELEIPVVNLKTGVSAAMNPCKYTGFDNGFNLPELSLGPVNDLVSLKTLIDTNLSRLSKHLHRSGLGLINFSEHPFTDITPEFYNRMRVPRPIYTYWQNVRGWNHSCGIDAKASIQSNIGVSAERALDALNVMIGCAPAFIAIYANSPFEGGRLTDNIENRLTLWTRMFENSTYPSDRDNGSRTTYFSSLSEYFEWMYGDNFIHAFPWPLANYKECDDVFVPLHPVTYTDFFTSNGIACKSIMHGTEQWIAPSIQHYEYFQFAKFQDARIRFFIRDNFRISEFKQKLKNFAEITETIYIEMRSPGTNLPDKIIRNVAGNEVADSVIISVCALMKGLLSNLDEALSYLPEHVSDMRGKAIRESVGNHQVRTFASRIIEVAQRGLSDSEKWMLSYPRYVVNTGLSNGIRGVQDYATGQSLQSMVFDRLMVL